MVSIEKSTIATRVSRELRRRIVAGEYPVGMKLQQEQIASELGVSRSPVREALHQLEAEGLILLVSQKGATVAPIHASEVSELFELRLLIEPYLLTLAIPAMTDTDFDAAEGIIAEMDNVELAYWGVANWRFHATLYRPAARPTIMKTLEKIHETFDRYIRLQIALTDGRWKAHADHRRILDACREGQAEVAAALLRQHISTAGSELALEASQRQTDSAIMDT
ncbi:MAG: GntR family transcriptional regulator [Bauldia litoralis]